MANNQKTKVPMQMLPAATRTHNFDEVAIGYSEKEMISEADRCLNCPTRPCIGGCPINNQIPDFIALAKAGRLEAAYAKIRENNPLPAVCGRVCPQELQCEKHCVRGRVAGSEPVSIGRIERFLADWHNKNKETKAACGENSGKAKASSTGQCGKNATEVSPKGIAVVGGGPSGLACASELEKMGYAVTIFEAEGFLGGVLVYGIPEFVLPNSVIKAEIDNILTSNIDIKFNTKIGRDITVDSLKSEFDAVFIAVGTGKSKSMGIENETAKGVFLADDYLYNININKTAKKSKHTIVVGGGNVAMDAARAARRSGAEVTVVYRRDREQMPSRHEEIVNTLDEGVRLELLSNPLKILTDNSGNVRAVECIRMTLIDESDSRGRKSKPLQGTNYILPCDAVVMALGYDAEIIEGIETDNKQLIKIDEKQMTNREGVFAGGDIVTGPLTVIDALRMGKSAAKHIDEWLNNKSSVN